MIMMKQRPALAIACLLLGLMLFAFIVFGSSPDGTPKWPLPLAIFCLSAASAVMSNGITKLLAIIACLLSGVAVVKCCSETIRLWRMQIERKSKEKPLRGSSRVL
jgi:hypothetical protein